MSEETQANITQQQPVAEEVEQQVVPSTENVSNEENITITSNGEEQEGTDDDSQQSNIVPANAIKGGRETSDKILYVGNLDKSIDDESLKQYFQVGGPVANVKIITDKNNKSSNYAFVEFFKNHDAHVALQTLNGKQIEQRSVKINWAFQSQQSSNEEHFNLFVGDLNIDVDDEALTKAFKDFPSFMQAHVMWDMQTGRSRGYGFASFLTKDEAQTAMEQMQGHELNGRPIRINWASKRENIPHSNNNNNRRPNSNNNNNNNNIMMMQQPPQQQIPPQMQMNNNMPQQQHMPMTPLPVNPDAVEDMIRRAPPRVTTAYIGNLPHFATEADLIPLLQNFGFILDFKHYPDRGICFIKYDTHEQAAVCIVALSNFPLQGRNLKTGWGKEKPSFMPPPPGPPMGNPNMMPPVMMGGSMPQHPMNHQQQNSNPQQDQEQH